MAYSKVYNPDSDVKVSIGGVEVRVGAKEFIVLEDRVVNQLRSNLPSLEVVPASDEEFAEYQKLASERAKVEAAKEKERANREAKLAEEAVLPKSRPKKGKSK